MHGVWNIHRAGHCAAISLKFSEPLGPHWSVIGLSTFHVDAFRRRLHSKALVLFVRSSGGWNVFVSCCDLVGSHGTGHWRLFYKETRIVFKLIHLSFTTIHSFLPTTQLFSPSFINASPGPALSFVHSHPLAGQCTPPSFVVFPWAPIIYQDPNPVAQTPANATPVPAAPQIHPVQAPSTLTIIIRAIRHFLAMIATKLRMRSAS
ncbi:hypothetical protein FB451DRAFT_1564537 [Mycena latifolia]|nr:hypothetical protein FB451DRAFT_1564537 [Mycena latifolia]